MPMDFSLGISFENLSVNSLEGVPVERHEGAFQCVSGGDDGITLGKGSFGYVSKVSYKGKVFALKTMRICDVNKGNLTSQVPL